MALIVEDGTGIVLADSYASNNVILAYWVNRPHSPFAAGVAAATSANLDGAARESSSYLDSKYGQGYRGVRMGRIQGLLFPRTGAEDEAGYPLPGLPSELVSSVCELTARALTATLVGDFDRGGALKREKYDKVMFEYFENAQEDKSYGIIAGLMAPLLNLNNHWAWA